ncbi:M56 family metallopeptidase [Pontiellaceae bacterium B1224]|nr:M56 family metallopeptidase [Pontiellaceae bacterium B1224]
MSLQFLETLVPALLHTLWIGLLSASLLFVALRATPGKCTRLRYALGLMALLSIFIGGLFAWELPQQPDQVSNVIMQDGPSSPLDPISVYESPVAPIISHSSATPTQPAGKTDWRKVAGMVWMAGALISLLRLLHVSWNIQRLIRQSRAIENPVVQRMVTELSRVAGLSRRVLLLTGEHIVQPAVIGIFRPVIFLPLSALTGLPEWQLRAILAHELAHIVRHDFLGNALQLLAETILFFNPAVWWINRRIREEREACCDVLAAEWIDSKFALAETLLEQATAYSTALPAFGGPNPGSLKNRILRLINPAQQPALKLPWKSLLLVLLFALGGLLLAKQGTSKMVGYLHRLQTLEVARDEYETPVQKIVREDVHGFKDIILEGSLKSEDGEPIPVHQMSFHFQAGNGSCGAYLYEKDFIGHGENGLLRFKKKLEGFSRVEYFYLKADGYAPVEGVGGAADRNGVLKLPTITLGKGYEGRIRFKDPSGNIVTNVTVVRVAYKIQKGSFGPSKNLLQPDRQGVLAVPNCSQFPFVITILPPIGYQLEEREISFKEDEIQDWMLKPAHITIGSIIDGSGTPVEGAKIFIQGIHNNPFYVNNPVAESKADGGFRFGCMEKGKDYMLVIVAPGHLRKYIVDFNVDYDGDPLVLTKGNELSVHLKNSQLLKNKNPYMRQYYPVKIGNHSQSFTTDPSWGWCKRVEKTDTMATFKLTNLMEGKCSLNIGWEKEYSFMTQEVSDSITIDIADLMGEKPTPPSRTPNSVALTLRLVTPNNEPMPTGTIELNYLEGYVGKSLIIAIPADGVIQTNLMVNPDRRITVSPAKISGYSISESIMPATSEIDVDCNLHPAGGAALNVVDEKRNSVTGYHVTVEQKTFLNRKGWRKGWHTDSHYLQIRESETDQSTCMVEPLDFENKYLIWVYKNFPEEEGGYCSYRSNWFTVSKSRPVKKIKCILRPRE